MADHDAFRLAVEARDTRAMVAALADDVVFHSPVKMAPFEGKAMVSALLNTLLAKVFEEFEYTDELEAPDGTRALVFNARVGDRQVQGLDLLRFDDTGLISDFTVMLRPRSGLEAVMEAVNRHLFGKD